LKIYISQGSVVMHIRCGAIFNDYFVTGFPQSVSVKEFWKSVNIWWTYDKLSGLLFWLAVYMHYTRIDTAAVS